jgi:hypothetical protein
VTAPALSPLLGRGRVHPWLHVDAEGVVVGRVTDAGEVQLMTSEREVFEPAAVEKALALRPRVYPDVTGRWLDTDAEEWLATGTCPKFSEVLALLIHELRSGVEFPREELATLVALWTVGTYFVQHCQTFPRLWLTGERGSGKSKVLAVLHGTAFNASLCVSPTPAVLFRLIEEARPTLLVDEAEALDADERRELLGIINVGYKRGATVPRVEGDRTRQVQFFSVYTPVALAGIRALNATTEDRCIPLVMQRGLDPLRINAEVSPTAPSLARIRDGCYRLLLARSDEVHAALGDVPLPAWLSARPRELWRPLLALAYVADQEDGAFGVAADLLALAREHVEDREGASPEAEALLHLLAERLGAAAVVSVRPGDLAPSLRERLAWKDLSAELVARWLRRLGFRAGRKDREGRQYEVTREALQAVTARYSPGSTVTPSPSQDNHAES